MDNVVNPEDLAEGQRLLVRFKEGGEATVRVDSVREEEDGTVSLIVSPVVDA